MKSPRLGIFWMVPANGAERLVTISHPEQNVPIVAGFRTTIDGHVDAWERICIAHRHLSRYSYEHFPRGRVNWREEDGRYLLLADRRIVRTGRHLAVARRWHLPLDRLTVALDLHYRTNALSTLFERQEIA